MFEFLNELKEEAEYYTAILKPNKDFWGKRGEDIVELIEELQTISKQQPLPLLMASCREEKLPNNEFKKLLKMCIGFIFRYLTISERENKELERLFSEIAIDIRKGRVKNTKEIKAKLMKEYVDDKTFENDFSKKQIKSVNAAKYILRKIENHISTHEEKVTNKITLEHIMPKTPDKEWQDYLKKNGINKDEWVNRIGNLTLLLEKPNNEASSKFFTYKRDKTYKQQTKLNINKDLSKTSEWRPIEIEERQIKLAKKAVAARDAG